MPLNQTRGFGGLVLIFLIFVVDPILSFVRRRWYNNTPYYSPPRRAFIRLAFAIPALTLVISSATYLSQVDDTGRAVLLIAVQFVFGCLIGRYFYNRAHGRESHLPGWGRGEIVEPDDPEFANDLWDILGLIAALMVLAMPVILTW